jgi:hypothetical protein
MASVALTKSGVPTTREDLRTSVTESRAARELQLRRGEFDLAVRLGRIRTFAEPARGPELPGMLVPRRRVDRAEIDRLQAAPGFPESLRASVRTDSAAQGAGQMSITTTRFTRLARLGLLVPVTFYVNRYRTVVWLYLAQELEAFAEAQNNRHLLTRPLPGAMRAQLDAGTDLRARSWRARHAGFLQRLAEGSWACVAVTASLLDEDEVEDIVDDPHERAYLDWLKPPRPDPSPPGSPAAQVVDELIKADDPDEVDWLRVNLAVGLAKARNERPAPRFASALPPKAPVGEPAQPGGPSGERADQGGDQAPHQVPPEPPPRPSRLLGRLRRGRT